VTGRERRAQKVRDSRQALSPLPLQKQASLLNPASTDTAVWPAIKTQAKPLRTAKRRV
jgi:hypothetical protein